MSAFVKINAHQGTGGSMSEMTISAGDKIFHIGYKMQPMSAKILAFNLLDQDRAPAWTHEEARRADERELCLIREALQEMEVVIGGEIIKAGRRAGHVI